MVLAAGDEDLGEGLRNAEDGVANGDSGQSPDGGEGSRGASPIDSLRAAEPNDTGSTGDMPFRNGGLSPGLGAGGLPGAALSALRMAGRALWGNKKRKATTISGSAIGMIVMIFFWMLSITSGPLGFIHIGEILGTHFGHMRSASMQRMGDMLTEIIEAKKTAAGDVGDTRLNFIERGIKNSTIKSLADKGITPKVDDIGKFQGFELDPSNEKSPYNDVFKGKGGGPDGLAAVADELRAEFGTKGIAYEIGDGKITVTGRNTLFSDTGIKAMSDMLVTGDHPFFDPIWNYVRVRILSQWTIAGFHPLRTLDAKVTGAKDAWVQSIKDFITKGTSADSTSGAAIEGKDAKGNPTQTPLEGGDGPMTADTAKTILSDPAKAAGAAGIVAAVAAVICLLKAVNDNIGLIRYAQVMLPMMREAMLAISVGSQVKSGQDISQEELDTLSKQFVTTDSKTGKITSTWDQAAPIQAETGGSGGVDMNPAIKDTFQGSPAWLAWTSSDPVKALCSEAAQVTLGVVSLGLILLPGVNVIEAAAGVVVFGAASYGVMAFLPGLLAGSAINPFATGAEWGNNIDYGAGLAANANALQYGGVKLTKPQVTELDIQMQAQNAAQFHSKSLAYRLFNLNDYRTVAGSMVDQLGIYGPQSIVAKFGSIPDIIGSLFRMPASVFSATAHAATAYNYPFPEYGFSQEDLNNDLVKSPYDNATAVGHILDNEASSGQTTYTDRALNCFGVVVSKGSDGWDAVPSTTQSTNGDDHSSGVDVYDDAHYNPSDCIDAGNNDWLRIRVWLLDTASLEGYACTQGDVTSCTNSGFNSGGATSSSTGNVVFYSQRDPRWGNKQVCGDGWCGTISDQGCFYTDEAMIFSTFTGQQITPDQVNFKQGSNWVSRHPSDYNLKDSGIINMGLQNSGALDTMTKAVQAGSLVMVHGISGNMFDGSSNHWIVFRGVASDGKLLVSDPYDLPDPNNSAKPKQGGNTLKEWTRDDFLSNANQYRIISK